jgi:phosphocarrier protein
MGLHARPAAELVKLAGQFQSEISLSRDGLAVNGKSIMGVLMLAAEHGSELHIRAEGPDAAEAVKAIEALVNRGFSETQEAEKS